VDEVLVWSAPWAGRPAEGASSAAELVRAARALRSEHLDLAFDLQGDVRANGLLWASGARVRVGYANTGGGWLLTHVVPLDETLSWVEQNRRAVATVAGAAETPPRFDALTPEDREGVESLLGEPGLRGEGPLVGLHPSGGRPIKQWPLARWIEVARRLRKATGARFVITGSAADAPLAAELCAALGDAARDMTGRLGVLGSLALIDRLDLFLSPDTGPMHMACAVDTPSVSVFGPSDPVRYFSGGSGAPGSRHVVVRHDLWCAPCNLIRLPPEECQDPRGPECLLGVSVEAVATAAEALLVGQRGA
jgi:heptosyltransferase-2/heptosyltransferase-3